MKCARTLPVLILVSLLNCQLCVGGMITWHNSSAYGDTGGTGDGDERNLRNDMLHGALVIVAIIITLMTTPPSAAGDLALNPNESSPSPKSEPACSPGLVDTTGSIDKQRVFKCVQMCYSLYPSNVRRVWVQEARLSGDLKRLWMRKVRSSVLKPATLFSHTRYTLRTNFRAMRPGDGLLSLFGYRSMIPRSE